jgi:hypothetical protein
VVEHPEERCAGERALDGPLDGDVEVAFAVDDPLGVRLGGRAVADGQPARGAIEQVGEEHDADLPARAA